MNAKIEHFVQIIETLGCMVLSYFYQIFFFIKTICFKNMTFNINHWIYIIYIQKCTEFSKKNPHNQKLPETKI